MSLPDVGLLRRPDHVERIRSSTPGVADHGKLSALDKLPTVAVETLAAVFRGTGGKELQARRSVISVISVWVCRFVAEADHVVIEEVAAAIPGVAGGPEHERSEVSKPLLRVILSKSSPTVSTARVSFACQVLSSSVATAATAQ